MAYPSGPGQMPVYSSWPVSSDPGATTTRTLRGDAAAGVLLVIGGLAGILQLWIPWQGGTGGSGGWQLFQLMKPQITSQSFAYTFAAYALLAVAVAGFAMVLLGCSMFMPIDHRPLGVVATFAGVIGLGCALWWLLRGPSGASISEVFAQASVGWYLFLLSGLVGLVGAIKSLMGSRSA